MGNRAVITTSSTATAGVGIYCHWNGGLESVLAFLEACKKRGYRQPGSDPSYAMARLCGLIHEFFGGDSSVGIGQLKELDCNNGDNGVYVIGGDWVITKRWGGGSKPGCTLDDLNAEQVKKFDSIVEQLTKKVEA